MDFDDLNHCAAETGSRNARVNELERPCGAVDGVGGASVCLGPENASDSPNSVPADLRAFVCALPIRDAARKLGLGLGTVDRLRNGYWPTRSHKIMRAWAEYKGRDGKASKWFLRRVRGDGVVPHGKDLYTAPALCSRVGELVAVARGQQGGLMVQTLDLPLQRFALDRVES